MLTTIYNIYLMWQSITSHWYDNKDFCKNIYLKKGRFITHIDKLHVRGMFVIMAIGQIPATEQVPKLGRYL